MTRKSVETNVARELWSQCGGFCQNPHCNRPLFASVGDSKVSLANVAHIIGHGADGPRSDHLLADLIDRDGISNLIMLCLDCHKVVDELEKKFSVETIQKWKSVHASKIRGLFQIPFIDDEAVILHEVDDLLEANSTIFKECGPFSENVMNGVSGDGLTLWRNRCFDTILPNHQKIVQLISQNRNNFSRPWDLFIEMMKFKVHVDAFQGNTLSDRKVNDYKVFPQEFSNFIKRKLGLSAGDEQSGREDNVDHRYRQLRTIIERYLLNHDFIKNLSQINIGTMFVELKDGRSLNVFVTCSYFFTDYTFDRVMEIDPATQAIVNVHPAGDYTLPAKQLCLDHGIGLFTLQEFMGAIRRQGDEYLNYLLKSESGGRLSSLRRDLSNCGLQASLKFFVFGSYLRRKIYKDVDLLIVYTGSRNDVNFENIVSSVRAKLKHTGPVDLTIASAIEFSSMRFNYNNLTQVWP